LSEPLIAVLPHNHPLAQRPMGRLFELKKEQLTITSRHIDPGSVGVEAMLRTTGIEASSIVSGANLIELLDHGIAKSMRLNGPVSPDHAARRMIPNRCHIPSRL
jgi:hypothetical protein